jgi:hypothetical protein
MEFLHIPIALIIKESSLKYNFYLCILATLISASHARAQAFPKPADFLDSVKDRLPPVKIDTVSVKRIEDLQQGIVAYDGNLIRLAYFLSDLRTPDFRSKKESLEFNFISKAIENHNIRIPALYVHEQRHYLNGLAVSKLGLSAVQIVQLNIHDEISARVADLLFRREVFLESRSVSDAFAGLARNDLPSEFPYDSKSLEIPLGYKTWLGKNTGITAEISQEEADVILEAAIKMLSANFQDWYAGDIIAISADDLNGNTREYSRFNLSPADFAPPQKAIGFGAGVHSYYSFATGRGTVNLLGLCGAQARMSLMKFVKNMMSDKRIKDFLLQCESSLVKSEAARKRMISAPEFAAAYNSSEFDIGITLL